MYFEIVGSITNVETITVGRGIRELDRVQKLYGKGRWRKMKGEALIRLASAGYGAPSCTGTRRTGLADG